MSDEYSCYQALRESSDMGLHLIRPLRSFSYFYGKYHYITLGSWHTAISPSTASSISLCLLIYWYLAVLADQQILRVAMVWLKIVDQITSIKVADDISWTLTALWVQKLLLSCNQTSLVIQFNLGKREQFGISSNVLTQLLQGIPKSIFLSFFCKDLWSDI